MSRAREIVADAGYGVLATCDEGHPRLRPMAFVVTDEGKLWSSTYDISGKVAELRHNANVEICFVDSHKNHLRVSGTVDLSGGPDKKARLLELNPKVGRHFSGGDDPTYVLVEVTPTRVRWTEPGFGEYHEDTLI